MKYRIIGPTAKRRPINYRGIINSQDLNDFQDEVVNDLTVLSTEMNTVNSELIRLKTSLDGELTRLRGELLNLKQQRDYEAQVAGTLNQYFTYYNDFRGAPELVVDSRISESSRAMLDPRFGQISLPIRQIQERFYTYSLDWGVILPPTDLTIEVDNTFAKNGETSDWEYGGKVTETDVTNAFTGGTVATWLRRVEFPMNSPVDHVSCQITVTVPRKSTSLANLLEVIPIYSTDIDFLGVSPDLTDTYTTVTAGIETAPPSRFHFAPTTVNKLRLQITQRRWVEEDGKKVFYYGLQEVGLKHVTYDKSYVAGADFGVNNTLVLKLSPPAGYYYDRLVRIDLDPPCLEDTNKYVRLQLATSLAGTPAVVWDSSIDSLPQRLADPPTLPSATDLYAIFELHYVDGTSATFTSDTTPYINGLGLTYKVSTV